MRAIDNAIQRTKLGEMPAFMFATRIQSTVRLTGFSARKTKSGCADTSTASYSSTIDRGAAAFVVLTLDEIASAISICSLQVTRHHGAERTLLDGFAHVAIHPG